MKKGKKLNKRIHEASEIEDQDFGSLMLHVWKFF